MASPDLAKPDPDLTKADPDLAKAGTRPSGAAFLPRIAVSSSRIAWFSGTDQWQSPSSRSVMSLNPPVSGSGHGQSFGGCDHGSAERSLPHGNFVPVIDREGYEVFP